MQETIIIVKDNDKIVIDDCKYRLYNKNKINFKK